jgi:hypothetical protein
VLKETVLPLGTGTKQIRQLRVVKKGQHG